MILCVILRDRDVGPCRVVTDTAAAGPPAGGAGDLVPLATVPERSLRPELRRAKGLGP